MYVPEIKPLRDVSTHETLSTLCYMHFNYKFVCLSSIYLSVCLSVCDHKNHWISRFRHLSIYNQSIEISKKLASVRFESLNMAHEHYKSCIFVHHI